MRCILVLHGTTAWNVEERAQGHSDTGLCHQGQEDALRVSERIAHFPVSAIISSDLRRAVQTAEILNRRFGVNCLLDSRLREYALGSLEGLTKTEQEERYGEKIRILREQRTFDFRPYGGEHRDSALSRFHEALDEYRSRYGTDAVVVIVSHSGILSTLLEELKHPPHFKRDEFFVLEW